VPISLDTITQNKLTLVKQVYEQAVLQSTSCYNITSRVLAVIEFDFSIETILRTVVTALDTTKVSADGFQSLIQQVETVLMSNNLGTLPDKGNILYVHTIRNDTQHKSKYPTENDVSNCQIYSRDFLCKVLMQVWGLSLEKITLANVITHEDIRYLLVLASQQFHNKYYSEAVDAAAEALLITFKKVEDKIVGTVDASIQGFDVLAATDNKIWDGGQILASFSRMREMVLFLALGIDYAGLIKYRYIVGNTYYNLDSKFYRSGGKPDLVVSDVEYVVAFCTNAVFQIQERVGNIDDPFGLKKVELISYQ